MTLQDFVQQRIKLIDLPHPLPEYDMVQPVTTACLGRDIYLQHRQTRAKVWLARFTATELIEDKVDWSRHCKGDLE